MSKIDVLIIGFGVGGMFIVIEIVECRLDFKIMVLIKINDNESNMCYV